MLSKKVSNLKPSPTLKLAEVARNLKAEGKNVISLSLGEPDWDTFGSIVDAVVSSVRSGFTKYVPASGILDLKEAVSQDTNSYLKTNYAAKNVSVTTGAKFSIYSALQSLLDDGDEVIVPAPYWVSYPDMVRLVGAKPVIVKTDPKNRFKITAAELKKNITSKTKLLMLNSPNNPTGEVYSLDELKQIADVLLSHKNIVVLSDDIYNKLVFEDSYAPHILGACPALVDRVVIVNGMSKAYSMTGWRIGWSVGPEDVVSAMSKFQSQSVSCAVSFCQKASVHALKHSSENLKKVVKDLRQRRDIACDLVSKIDGLKIAPPGGAFYLWIDVSHFLNKKFNGLKLETSSSIAKALLDAKHVVMVPGIDFGYDGFIRMSYVLEQDKIKEAVHRMKDFFSSIN